MHLEFFLVILDKFSSECSSFEHVKHHLFCMYVDVRTELLDCGHYSITRNMEHFIFFEFEGTQLSRSSQPTRRCNKTKEKTAEKSKHWKT